MGGRGAVLVAVVVWASLLLAPVARGGTLLAWLVLSAGAAWMSHRAPPHTARALVLLALAAAALARGGASGALLERQAAHLAESGTVARLTVVLDEPPRREGGEPVAAVRVIAASPALAQGTRLRLRWPAGGAGEWADTLDVLARLDPPTGPRLPGGFDARAAMRAQGLAGHAHAFTAQVWPARGLARVPLALATRMRRACERALARGLGPEAHELAAPLLFGDRSAMTTEVDSALRASGLVHLLALSGLHVAWMAAVARGAVAMLGASARARALAGALCALAYALLAGPIPSLWRASATELVVALAQRTQRALDPVQALAVSAVGLLVVAPGWAADLGFQLSCAATLGLVLLCAPIVEAIQSPFVLRRSPTWLLTPFAATVAAQAVALPLLIARFHAVPWTGLVANLAAVPIAELLLAGAWLGALADAVLPGAGALWFSACTPLASAMRWVSASAAAAPLALWPCGDGAWAAWTAAIGSAALLVAMAPPRAALATRPARWRGPGRAVGLVALGLSLLTVASERELRPARGSWWLVVLDVGQGDALALATADGWWLIDTGARSPQWDAGEGVVLPFLRWAGVRRLQALVLTHDDSDHTGGAGATRRGVQVRRRFVPAPLTGVPGPGARLGGQAVLRGDTLRAAEPAIVVLWPPRDHDADAAVARRGDNAASIVLQVGEGRHSALLLADVDSVSEARLSFSRVALIKAGHHGSASSTGGALLSATSPERAVLSCGRRNRYGHPDPRVLQRLAAAGVACDRTDRAGSQVYAFEPGGMRRVDWRGGDWHRPTPASAAAGICSAARAR